MGREAQRHFAALSWKDFEVYVVGLLDRLYAPHGLRILHTPYTSDGGRDGYACLTIGPPEVSVRGDPLAISLSIWAEVKKRHRGVGLDDIGGHFILAVDARVNKILFITDSHFTEATRESCLRVAERNNVQVTFLTGEDLLQLERRLTAPSSTDGATPLLGEVAPPPILGVKVRLASLPNESLPGRPADLLMDCGDVFYLIAEVTAGPGIGPAELVLTIAASKELHFTALRPEPISLDILGGVQRATFAVWADQPGRYGPDEMPLEIRGCPEGPSIALDQAGGVRIHRPLLVPDLTAARRGIVDEADRLLHRVGDDVPIACMLLEATAGSGKSHLLRALKQRFLPRGVRVLHVEGETHRTLSDVVRTLFCAAVPVGGETLAHIEPAVFETWAEADGISISGGHAYGSLRALLSGNSTSVPLDTALTLAAAALSHVSRSGHVVVSFEDLHKANASVLEFFQRLSALMATRRVGAVLFVFTSRPHSEADSPGLRSQWERAFAQLTNGRGLFACFRLDAPTVEEAAELLVRSVSGLSRVEAFRIIGHTGSTPFHLREALNYLHTVGVISVSRAAGAYVADSARLSMVLDSPILRSATRARLEAFAAAQPEWIDSFLLLGACLGSEFQSGIAATALGVPRKQLVAAYRSLERFEILRSSRTFSDEKSDVAFDHDLIREGVLERAGALRVRQAAMDLMPYLDERTSLAVRLVIFLMGGALDAAADLAEAGLRAARAARNAAEGLQLALARAYALLGRGDFVAANGFLQSKMAGLDRGLLYAAPPRRPRRPGDDESPEPIVAVLEQMTATGVMEDELATRLITLGAMQAETQSDAQAKAQLHYFDGRRLFGQARYLDAYEHFRVAQRVWPEGTRSRSPILSEIRVRIAICERHLGQHEDAHRTMLAALRLRCGVDWPLFQSVVANLGAFVMYDDQPAARRYWRKGLRAASCLGDMAHVAHFTNDLAHLDLMEGRYAEALRGIDAARAIAERHGSVKEMIRADIFRGCVGLATGDLVTARRALLQAEEQASANSNFRRLWRIRADLATVDELEGHHREALIRDLQSVHGMPSVTESLRLAQRDGRFTRELCALVNIEWRTRARPDLYSELWAQFESTDHAYFTEAVQAIEAGFDVHGWLGGLTCLLKPVGDGTYRRFLITE